VVGQDDPDLDVFGILVHILKEEVNDALSRGHEQPRSRTVPTMSPLSWD